MSTTQSIEPTSPTPDPVAPPHDMPSASALTDSTSRGSFRPEVQGLRALAVGLVVLFHLWPLRLRGGYVGVDVFFVISGYLITSHIFREVAETGTLRVTRFWARRIRRLLPAALLVLALSALAVLVWVPATMWQQTAHQVAASALYVENWALAFDSVDYMATDNLPTVAQHYWSLSVEEQFYLVWPLFIVALLAAQRRWPRPGAAAAGRTPSTTQQRTVVLAGLCVLMAASLAWSVWSTARDPAYAYLSTFTRVWEFAVGALAGLLVLRLPRRVALVAGWAGVAAVVLAGLTYTATSLIPGYRALLPVIGTVLVILAGRGGAWSAGWWLSLRPARVVGDLSYSVYLVHWPLIVLVPFVTGHALRWPEKAALLAATVALAWLLKTVVEDPLRVRPLLSAAPWRAFAFAAVGALVLVGANVGVQRDFDHREQVAAVRADRLSPGTCLGPAALAPGNGCGSVGGEGPSTVAPEVVAAEGSQPIFQRCLQVHGADLKTCHLGTRLQPKRTVALVGDSHAGALLPVMDEIGKQLQWDVIASTKGSCPATTARRVLPDETGDDKQVSCEQFNAAASRQILDNPKISDVFVASMTSRYRWDSVPGGTSLDNPGIAGFQTTWKAWTAAGKRVHVVRDVPTTDNKRIPMCLALATGATGTCDTSRATALPEDLAVTAALSLRSPLVEVIDLTSQFCSRTTCYAQVGNVMVYRDTSHLSVEYSRLLAPAIIAQLGRSAGSPDTGAGARRG